MLFLSTFHNKIDKKGRVSVPAQFRAVLVQQRFNGMIAYASLRNPCIEACGMERFLKLHARLEKLDPFSEEHDALATALFGESVQLAFDGEGRVMVPDTLRAAARIGDDIVFVGKGETFEMWEPKAYATHAAGARTKLKDSYRNVLGGSHE